MQAGNCAGKIPLKLLQAIMSVRGLSSDLN